MDDLDRILSVQRAAVEGERPVSAAARKDRLHRAIAMLRDHAEMLCDAMSADFGHRSRHQSMLTDIESSVGALRHAIRRLDGWMRPRRRPVRFPLGLMGARAWVEYQPKGVVGIIAPWNFPVNLVMAPLAGAFAAGNRVMVKTSEYTPATAAAFADLAPRYFAADELAFVSGDIEVGRAFAALPFDHLLFTGATAVGREVLRAAADNLTPVTLELGGKSPVIVGTGADIRQVAERVTLGKMMNAGQICLAPDYVLVPEAEEEALAAAIRGAAATLYPTLLDNPDYTSIIDDRHHRRLTDAVADARAKGAEVEIVNPAQEDVAGANGRKLPLHIVRHVRDDMSIMSGEIFGPVLPIIAVRDADAAIAYVNARPRPLALYYFGPDAAERRRVLDGTVSGGVTIDDVIFHVSMEDLPFGGIGASGMGAYHGEEGFRTFSHARALYRQPRRFDIAKLAGMRPPFR